MCGGERAGGTHRVNAAHTQAAADTAEAATAEVQKHSRRQEKHAAHWAADKLRCRESSQVNACKERRQQQCCFHLSAEQLECNRVMHKLALIDNCTQVLLPTQASSSALASTQQPCNSHASQPQTKARGPQVGARQDGAKAICQISSKSVEHSSPESPQTRRNRAKLSQKHSNPESPQTRRNRAKLSQRRMRSQRSQALQATLWTQLGNTCFSPEQKMCRQTDPSAASNTVDESWAIHAFPHQATDRTYRRLAAIDSS